MQKLIYSLLLFTHILFALEIDQKTIYNELLSHTEIYIDKSKQATIDTIKEKSFQINDKEILGFGYAPDFHVWVKFTLTNTSSKRVNTFIEYANPLTSSIKLYDGDTEKLIKKSGLTDASSLRNTINPSFSISVQPNSSKTFYLKAHSETTALIIKLNLWSKDTYYQKEIRYQFILALFFGALGIIIIYHFMIYLSTKEISYLYYVLSFIGIIFYYLIYKGVANVYLFTPEQMAKLIPFSTFIVAIPVFFLALFTRSILELEQYPTLHRILNYMLMVFPLLIVMTYLFELNQYRSIFSILLLAFLVFTTMYAFLKKNRQAKYIIVGWIVFFSSALFMWLSSLGVYDIFATYPHYTEYSILAEASAFSFALADRIKQLTEVQKEFIAYQNKETTRLTEMVQNRTVELEKSLADNQFLLKELNHRVKNSMQTIISFLRLQYDETENPKSQTLLKNIENKIFAINELYALLNRKENIATVKAQQYFSKIINNVQSTFHREGIIVHLDADTILPSEDAVYCGFILNEALTNIYQHAFNHKEDGDIYITLTEETNAYRFVIEDNGSGYTDKTDGLGTMIIETLATVQLEEKIEVDTTPNGVKIIIDWSKNEQ